MSLQYLQKSLILLTVLLFFRSGLEEALFLYAQDETPQSSSDASSKVSSNPHPIFVLPEEYTEAGRKNISDRLRSVNASDTLGVAESLRLSIQLVRPTIVYLETTSVLKPAGSGSNRHGGVKEFNNEAGAGFIIERLNKQYVVTNGHVIHAEENVNTPQNVNIYLADGRMVHPVKILSDPATDIALLEIRGKYLTLDFGDSDAVQVGDIIISAGSPFGLKSSFSSGIVSAKGRRNLQVGKTSAEIQDYIQTDASINPGNSGGPLVNLRGEVIGINVAIASNTGYGEGVSFAIPSKLATAVINQLVLSGKVECGWLGASFDSNYSTQDAAKLGVFAALFPNRHTPVYPPRIGARVLATSQSSPAENAGLQFGDVILFFNGTVVEDKDHLIYLVRITRPGKTVPLVFFRSGKLYDHKITIGRKNK